MRAGETVGRHEELAEIEHFLVDLRVSGALLTLEGDPGIGKTTLLRAALERARHHGMRILVCRPVIAEAKMPFAGLADMLAEIRDAELLALPDLQRRALEVALLRAEPDEDHHNPRLVGQALLSLVRSLADSSPVLLAIDDAQWLDAPTRRTLSFTARRLDRAPIGLLSAFRPEGDTLELGDLERSLPPGTVRRVRLGPLDLNSLRRLIGDRLGQAPPPGLAERIAHATHGNTFYALEIARRLPPGATVDDRLPVPEDIRSLTRARVADLPAATREQLLLATVLAVPQARRLDAEALAPAEQAGLIAVGERGRLEFAHPLFAAALYAEATEAQRRAAHRAAAELVTEPEQRARHLAYGTTRRDARVAAELEAAAGVARSRGAPAFAAELSELAAEMTPPGAVDDWARRTVTAATLRVDAGDLARARELIGKLGSPRTPDVVRARALRLRAVLEADDEGFASALASVRAGLALAAGSPELHAALELDAAFYLVGLGAVGDALGHAEAAIGRAELPGADHGVLGDALAVITMVNFLAGEGLDRTRLGRALALEDPDRERFLVTSPRYIAGLLEMWTGELPRAIATLSALRAERLERGVEADVGSFSFYLVWCHMWLGETAAAARLAEADAATLELIGDRGLGSALTRCGQALVAAQRGQLELAREHGLAALERLEAIEYRVGTVWPRWALGLAELGAGHPARAHAAMAPLLGMMPAMGLADPIGLMFLPDEVEALVALGEVEQAEALTELLGRLGAHHDRAWALAAAARCRGLVAAARGDIDRAIAEFEEAIDEHDRAPMPVERGRTLLALGRARRRRKRWAASRAALREALELLDGAEAAPWAAAARSELARAGETGADPSELTATERRVAQLAAAGLSNQAVADQAFLTVKAVEANLTRVYRKLDIRSRRELAGALQLERDDGLDAVGGVSSGRP